MFAPDSGVAIVIVSSRNARLTIARTVGGGHGSYYLLTRPDIDSSAIAYYGVSWDGYLGGIFPAIEPRFKASILYVAGLARDRGMPEVEPINFLPRIRNPVLMLNGRYDYFFPVESSQKPFFRLLGTPAEHARPLTLKQS